jgi:hypothetical protein
MRIVPAATTSICIATALLASTLLRAQDAKVALPGGTTTTTTVEVKKDVTKRQVIILDADVGLAQQKLRNEVVKRQVIRFAAPQPDGRMVVGNLQPLVQNFTIQLRPMMRAEYHFLRSVCRLTQEQRKGMARSAERSLHETVQELARMQQGGIRIQRLAGGQTVYPEPRGMIQKRFLAAAKQQLSPDQATRYAAELEKRAVEDKKVALDNLMAKFDHELLLSDEQRQKIRESLSSHWTDAWRQSPQTLFTDTTYFPPIADEFVVPYLEKAQRSLWHNAIKTQQFGWGNWNFGGFAIEDDPLEDRELVEAREAISEAKP